jgi:acetyl-CoA synthetase
VNAPSSQLSTDERRRLDAHLRDRAALSAPTPPGYAIPIGCCDRWADDATRRAMLDLTGREPRWLPFAYFAERSRRLGNGLRGLGVGQGERVAVILPQGPETATVHLAVYRLGAITVPLSVLHGPEAIAHRLGDAGVRVAVVGPETWERVADDPDLAGLCTWVVADGQVAGLPSVESLVGVGRPDLDGGVLGSETPAMIVYTSGTTGLPKGALHAHRVVEAHAAPIHLAHNGFPRDGDLLWSPADWAWAGGLVDCLLSAWHAGMPIVAYRGRRFDPEAVLDLLVRHGVRNTFLPPTALRMLRAAIGDAPRGNGLPELRSIMTGGEPVGPDLGAWARDVLNTIPNEAFGQTEASMVLGNASTMHPVKFGSPGFAYPNSTVAILREDGTQAHAGELGEIAIRADSTPVFLGYWQRPDATDAKVRDGWVHTGDLGLRDDDGFFWFSARMDDVIISAGYRIGPGEIEACIAGHPSVAGVAVVGVPDPERGQAVKAVVELRDPLVDREALAATLKATVRGRLAAYEVPREIEFVDQLPRTVTGKVQRSVLRGTS